MKKAEEVSFFEDDLIGILEEGQDRYVEALKKIQPATYRQIADKMGVQYTSAFRHRILNRVRTKIIKEKWVLAIWRRGGSQPTRFFMLPDFDFDTWKKNVVKKRHK